MASEDVRFIAQDAIDNIARIKNASWRVLASEAAIFAFLIAYHDYMNLWPVHIFFLALSIFLMCVVCFVYPAKIRNYRNRLKRALLTFDQQAQDVHGTVGKISDDDIGDYVYVISSLLSFMAILFYIATKFFYTVRFCYGHGRNFRV